MKRILMKIPDINKLVEFNDNQLTFVIGNSQRSKIGMTQQIAKWAESHNENHSRYDGTESIDELPEILSTISDEDIIRTCEIMSSVFIDFSDDIQGHHKAFKQNYPHTPTIKNTIKMAGSGYSKMFVLVSKIVINKPKYMFINYLEASLHPMVAETMLKFLMSRFPSTRYILTLAENEVIYDKWEYQHKIDYIDIDSECLEDFEDFNFTETFGVGD